MTGEGEVRVGQVWADADPRASGRRFEITEIEGNRARGVIRSVERNVSAEMIGQRTRWLLLSRFKNNNRGYWLVSDPDTDPAAPG